MFTASLLLAFIIFADAGPKGPRPEVSKAKPATEVCSLVRATEIDRVHKAKITGSKPSTSAAKGFRYEQCFHQAEAYPESVIVTVASPDPKHPQSAREFWRETMVKAAHSEAPAGEPTTKSEAKKQRHKPMPVPGVGDEAYWTGDRSVGALYVLKGDRFLRISVGGKGTAEEKREQSIQLARIALQRM